LENNNYGQKRWWIGDLEYENRKLCLNFKLNMIVDDEKWWKEATPATNESYHPWKDNNASNFLKNVAKIKDTDNCSISFQVDNGKAFCFGKIIEE
jgi:hypothetical protein